MFIWFCWRNRLFELERASRGVKELFGDVLKDNHRMLKLCRELGFEIEHFPEEPEIVRARMRIPNDG